MFNECQKIAKGPIYMFMVDDMVFESKSWDKAVIEAFEKSNDKILFVYPSDGIGRHVNFGAIGFLHKNWIDTVGYFIPPYFPAFYADKWINELAIRLNRRVYLGQMIVENLLILDDQTHKEYEVKINDSRRIYHSGGKKKERTRDLQLLQNFIDNFNPVRNA